MGSYGVATQNPFGLLDNENEDPQLLAAAAKVAPAAKPAKKEAVKEEAKAPVAQGAAGGRGDAGRGDGGRGRGGRGDARGRGRGGRGGRFDRPSGDGGEVAATENGYDAAPARGGEGFRARGRGGEGFRGGRGGRGGRGRGEGGEAPFEGRPRRDYDRRDGTGRGHEAAKRGGAGKGNWGTTGDEANQAENPEAPTEETPEAAAAAPAAEPTETPAEEAAAAEPAPEEVKEMTLDEYEKLLAEKKEALNRKAEAPSVDLAGQFAGMKALTKVDTEEEENPLELQKHKKDPKQVKEKARKEKETLQANFRVGDDPVRPRGGGRGGDRGGRGRGGDRGERGDRPDRPDRGDRPASGRAARAHRPRARHRRRQRLPLPRLRGGPPARGPRPGWREDMMPGRSVRSRPARRRRLGIAAAGCCRLGEWARKDAAQAPQQEAST